MAFCPHCGTRLGEQATRCSACGTETQAPASSRFKGTMMMTAAETPLNSAAPRPSTPTGRTPPPGRSPSAAPAHGTMLGGLSAPPGAAQPQAQSRRGGDTTTNNPPAAPKKADFKGTMLGGLDAPNLSASARDRLRRPPSQALSGPASPTDGPGGDPGDAVQWGDTLLSNAPGVPPTSGPDRRAPAQPQGSAYPEGQQGRQPMPYSQGASPAPSYHPPAAPQSGYPPATAAGGQFRPHPGHSPLANPGPRGFAAEAPYPPEPRGEEGPPQWGNPPPGQETPHTAQAMHGAYSGNPGEPAPNNGLLLGDPMGGDGNLGGYAAPAQRPRYDSSLESTGRRKPSRASGFLWLAVGFVGMLAIAGLGMLAAKMMGLL